MTSRRYVLDIVVAVTVHESSLSHSVPHLEEILHQTNEKMSAGLRDKSVLCMLGHAAVFCTHGASAVSKLGNTAQSKSPVNDSCLLEPDLITDDHCCCKVAES
ncbi:hypothetical protein MLD38_028813 [Melastoma candidum]|uniref:Uncharacterized protein n=1 Tax=Melastoma candidum TaxID=119954 RepID=A0ACB9N4C9_9MYRT|nr:hypothetical protein MLD38_028813 [Melastoma candidum]